MPSFSDVYAAVKLDLSSAEEAKLKQRIGKIDASKAGASAGKSFGGGFSKSFGSFAKGLLAGAGIVGGIQLFSGFISDAKEAAAIGRITEQVIKSTGGSAKISAKGVADLSEAISNKVGVDDELIQTGSNLLLTFKNVRNEVGKGANIFDRATQAAVDLSAAGFGDVTATSKQLGKALNDPLKGLTALGKAGVTFTAQQKEQIKTLVESGDILSAQKIILKEVEEQVGGAAEAAAGPLDKLKVIAGNLGEQVGTFLLPHLERFATWLIDMGIPKIKEIGRNFREDWLPPIKEVVGWIIKNKDVLGPLVIALGGATVAIKLVNAAMRANVIGIVITAVALLIGWIVKLWRENETFRAVVSAAWRAIRNTVIDGVRFIVDAFLGFVEAILGGAEKAFGWIPGIGDKLKTAKDEFGKFRRDVNIELTKLRDEDINIKFHGVASSTSSVASFERRGGPGGSGGGSPLHTRPFTDADAMGGSLGVNMVGLNAKRYAAVADSLGDRIIPAMTSRIKNLFTDGLVAPTGASGWRFPLPSGRYRVGSPFGMRNGRLHGGQDFPAATGTPVFASRAGVVSRALRLAGSYGLHTFLDHPGGWQTRYAHLSQMFVRVGQMIKAGQRLGLVGSTGNSTGPHLHYENLLGGRARNPKGILFDSGGWLPTGTSLVHNGTGRPERVVSPTQEFGGDTFIVNAPMVEQVMQLERMAQRRRLARLRVVT